jgi:hypothetical protein
MVVGSKHRFHPYSNGIPWINKEEY